MKRHRVVRVVPLILIGLIGLASVALVRGRSIDIVDMDGRPIAGAFLSVPPGRRAPERRAPGELRRYPIHAGSVGRARAREHSGRRSRALAMAAPVAPARDRRLRLCAQGSQRPRQPSSRGRRQARRLRAGGRPPAPRRCVARSRVVARLAAGRRLLPSQRDGPNRTSCAGSGDRYGRRASCSTN